MKPVVVGGDDFRPVGIAAAPDGSLYISDWVDKDYSVHGKGRIWRLRMPLGSTSQPAEPPHDAGVMREGRSTALARS